MEAYPPSENVTHVTVDMLLEPSGEVTIQSWGDQLHGYCHLDIVGSIIPKTSVHLETLHSICMRVAYVCQQNYIMGYVSVGLATFVDHSTMKQKVRLKKVKRRTQGVMIHMIWFVTTHIGWKRSIFIHTTR